jgi:hypothetical protein
MKYVVMFVHRPDLDEAIPQQRADEVYGEIFKWFDENFSNGKIVDGGAQLQPPSTATTVRSPEQPGGDPIVVDGPFLEAKENIGGFSMIDVPDLDAAIALVKTWPSFAFPGVSVEIRPIVDHSGDV